MTVKAAGNAFVRYGHGQKVETDADMAERFAAACRRLGVKQATVLRQIIWEFVTEAEKVEEAVQ